MSKRYSLPKMRLSRKSELGFSIIEIVVAMGIMAVVSGLFATSVVQLQKSQVHFEDRNDSLVFTSGLSTSLLSDQQTCTNLLTGIALTNNPTEITINNYSGLGSQTNVLRQGTTLVGTDSDPRVRVQSLTIQAKPGVPDTRVLSAGVEYIRKVAVLSMIVQRRDGGNKTNGGQTQYITSPPRLIEVPVYLQGNTIQTCQISMTRTDVCNTMGAGIDPSNTSQCLPQEQCFVKGSFFVSNCSPPYAGCNPGSVNPITGAQSCPPKSTQTTTGMYTQTYEVSCGKKCSQTIVNTLEFFMCMQCN